jgi:hypothetical protein
MFKDHLKHGDGVQFDEKSSRTSEGTFYEGKMKVNIEEEDQNDEDTPFQPEQPQAPA